MALTEEGGQISGNPPLPSHRRIYSSLAIVTLESFQLCGARRERGLDLSFRPDASATFLKVLQNTHKRKVLLVEGPPFFFVQGKSSLLHKETTQHALDKVEEYRQKPGGTRRRSRPVPIQYRLFLVQDTRGLILSL